jgi:hypothetical protein
MLYYTRPTAKSNWAYREELSPVTTQDANNPNSTILLTNNSFASSTSVRGDGLYLAAGAPAANAAPLVVGSTTSNGNRLVLSAGTTANFILNGPIVFSNTALGTIVAGKTYYVSQIIDPIRFTISSTPGGEVFTLENRSGAMPVYANHGYVVLYTRNANGYYVFSNLVTAPTKTNNQFFGHKVAIVGDKLFVASKGSATVAPSLTVYYVSKLVANALDSTFVSSSAMVGSPVVFTSEFAATLKLKDMSVAANGNVILSFSDDSVNGNDKIRIWNYSNTYEFNKDVQTIESTLPAKSNFGSTIAVSKDGRKLAIGAPTYSNAHLNEGAVEIYSNIPSEFTRWAVVLPGVTTSSTTKLTIKPGIKTFTVRKSGTGLLLNVVATFGTLRANPGIANAGTGYAVDDIVFISGGDGKATYKVTQVNPTTGAVVAGELVVRGINYNSNPLNVTTPKPLNILDLQRVTITYVMSKYH